MIYINRKDSDGLETVDEFNEYCTFDYATSMLKEYRLSDPCAHYYISQRACKAWREEVTV